MDEAIISATKLSRDIRIHFYGLYPIISIGSRCYPKPIMEGDGIKKKRDIGNETAYSFG